MHWHTLHLSSTLCLQCWCVATSYLFLLVAGALRCKASRCGTSSLPLLFPAWAYQNMPPIAQSHRASQRSCLQIYFGNASGGTCNTRVIAVVVDPFVSKPVVFPLWPCCNAIVTPSAHIPVTYRKAMPMNNNVNAHKEVHMVKPEAQQTI